MATNMGTFDRGLRVIVGVFLLSLVVVGPRTLWGLVGLVSIGTALVGWCPLYALFGLTTCPSKTAS